MDITMTEDEMTEMQRTGARLLNALSIIPPDRQPPSIIMFTACIANMLPAAAREEMLVEFEKAAEELSMQASKPKEVEADA